MVALRQRYQKTKFGHIPVDWEIKRLKDIGTSIIGLTYKPEETVEEGGTLVLRSSNIRNGRLVFDDNVYVKKCIPQKLFLKKGDLLICSRNGSKKLIGKNALVREDTKYTFGAFMSVFRSKYSDYLYQLFQTEMFNKQVATNLGATINQITTKDINAFQFPFPKEEKEQKKIVSILSTWDKAIESKEKLIDHKKQQKKGLMQKLLTGEVRLPGYSGEWKKVKLGEILKERKETGYTELELLAITSSKGVVKRTEVDIKDNSSEDKSKYKRILPNDIGYNTMRMWQGVSGVSKYEGIVSPAYTILKPTNKVNSNFIGYLFKLPKIINLFRRYSQGLVSDTLNLKYENLKGIKVTIPQDVEEQKKIAEILLSIDNEIEMLQEYVNYLKQQKKGLMQLL
ncbi:restriction endonuclease subunit S, partial [Heyndrickxia coagulans]|uniref:restriction endonuclease subunit S n=1 Tax=Heyndrickxia coagulans TaxID=1398 RepID=UPI002E0A1CC1|nr:restriction endonuclease subunit S [Heyndrickxia coagulans]